jgi:hypothetical protein
MHDFKALRNLIGPFALIHERAGPGLLRLARRGIFGLWMVKLLLDPLWRLAEFPPELFTPIGILRLLPRDVLAELLTGRGLAMLWALTLLVLAGVLSNKFFPLTSVLTAVLLTVYSCLVRGFGPAVHTDIVLLLAVYVLALFSWADLIEERRARADHPNGRPRSPAWSSLPLVTIVALLTLSYCLVGLNRVVSGGPRIFTGDTMLGWTVDAALRGYYYNTDIGWHLPGWPIAVWLLRLGLPVITCFEITAPLCLMSAHYRWVFIPTMLLFHLLSLVFMNIFFYEDMLLYLLLVDWSRAKVAD